MKNAIITLLAYGMLGTLAVPVRADTAVIQNSIQPTDTVGNINYATPTGAQGIRLNVLANPIGSTVKVQ